jgi:hypothetical protein
MLRVISKSSQGMLFFVMYGAEDKYEKKKSFQGWGGVTLLYS